MTADHFEADAFLQAVRQDRAIPANAARVAEWLAGKLDHLGAAPVFLDQIAEDLDVTVKTVRRALARLEAECWFLIVRPYGRPRHAYQRAFPIWARARWRSASCPV